MSEKTTVQLCGGLVQLCGGLRLFGNSVAIDAEQRRNNARGERAGGAGTTCRRSALGIESTPLAITNVAFAAPHHASVKTCSRLTRHSDKYTIRSLRARRIFSDGRTIPLNVFETTLIFTPAFLANALWLPARSTSERSNRSTSWRLSNRAECPIENFMLVRIPIMANAVRNRSVAIFGVVANSGCQCPL
jgi:hypothetical protein